MPQTWIEINENYERKKSPTVDYLGVAQSPKPPISGTTSSYAQSVDKQGVFHEIFLLAFSIPALAHRFGKVSVKHPEYDRGILWHNIATSILANVCVLIILKRNVSR